MLPKQAFALLMCLLSVNAFAQTIHPLLQKIESIAANTKGKVGVAVLGFEDRQNVVYNGNLRFPMQSVYKFPLAMAVLHEVDRGHLSLNQKIHLSSQDLLPNTHSPLRDKYPTANVDVTLSEILRYTVSESDNNGCDVLFRLLGGTKKVHEYVRSLGVKEIAIVGTEEEMHHDWAVQYANYASPYAMLQLLEKFYQGNTLTKSSRDFLWQLMVESPTGANRIKSLLPKGTIVAHKTGTGGRSKSGIVGAINDAGIVTLPNRKHFGLVVFVSNAPEPDTELEGIIAQISKAVWDYAIGN